ncbi:MAG: ribosomal protein L7/L12 [Phycisphaerales bacterium]
MPFGIRFKKRTTPPSISPENAIPVVLISHENLRNKIQLIKHIHEASGLGLKDAKDLADQLTAGHQPTVHCLSEDHALYLIDAAAQLGVTAKHADQA